MRGGGRQIPAGVGNTGHFSDRVQFTTEKRLLDNPSKANVSGAAPALYRTPAGGNTSPNPLITPQLPFSLVRTREKPGLRKRLRAPHYRGSRAAAEPQLSSFHFKMVWCDPARLQPGSNGHKVNGFQNGGRISLYQKVYTN